uniref:Uncharacterized protein n=1 Tax=Aegilops tauschii subsp. strangulata TaxID=200361 RepID=A0A453CV06_AEGTS
MGEELLDFLLITKEQMLLLLEQGTVFGLLGTLIHYIKVGPNGQTLLLTQRDVNVFSVPLMTQPCVSWLCK